MKCQAPKLCPWGINLTQTTSRARLSMQRSLCQFKTGTRLSSRSRDQLESSGGFSCLRQVVNLLILTRRGMITLRQKTRDCASTSHISKVSTRVKLVTKTQTKVPPCSTNGSSSSTTRAWKPPWTTSSGLL
jgi:hypothetical protein